MVSGTVMCIFAKKTRRNQRADKTLTRGCTSSCQHNSHSLCMQPIKQQVKPDEHIKIGVAHQNRGGLRGSNVCVPLAHRPTGQHVNKLQVQVMDMCTRQTASTRRGASNRCTARPCHHKTQQHSAICNLQLTHGAAYI